jgi:hypothetical protein
MSITLTNAFSVSQGVSVVESDTASATMGITIDYQLANPSAMITLKTGNVSGLSLVPGSIAANVTTISVDLTGGKWSSTSGQSGTLSGGALMSLLTTLKGLRNSSETFAVTNGIVAGSQVAW